MKARAEGKKLHTNTEIKCKPCFSTSALHTRTSNHTRLLVPTRANNSHTEMLGGIHPACNVQCEPLQRYWREVGKMERWFYKANSKLRFKVWKKKQRLTIWHCGRTAGGSQLEEMQKGSEGSWRCSDSPPPPPADRWPRRAPRCACAAGGCAGTLTPAVQGVGISTQQHQ